MTTSERPKLRYRAVWLAAVALVAGCGWSPPGRSGGEASPVEVACEQPAEFDSADFVDPTEDTNPYHPLRPGTQWVRGGSTLVGDREVPHQVITTLTDVVREIDGVTAIAMLDESTDSGEVAQVGMDYLALDRHGNVWLVGGYTEDYEGGEYTNYDSAWLGAGEDNTVGILSPAEVTLDTPPWCIGGPGDEDPSVGSAVDVAATVCVEFGCFDQVRVVQEGEADAPDNENKFYAPGVGVVKNDPLDSSLHQDRFELQNMVQLSEIGLAEASETVLELEAHARQVAPDVFGGAPVAGRIDG